MKRNRRASEEVVASRRFSRDFFFWLRLWLRLLIAVATTTHVSSQMEELKYR